MGPPQDLYELYMTTRAELSSAVNFYQYYMKLMLLVDIGKEMLPDSYNFLREEAEEVLSSPKSYPESRQMERDSDGYRLGPGSDSTGLIHIRNEDLREALDEVKNQQATTLIPKLKKIDSKIFKALVDCGIIDIKKPQMEEILMQDIMYNIQKARVGVESGGDGAG